MMDATTPIRPATGAESVLLGLKRAGIDYLFANAGTDFPPVIEALAHLPASSVPEAVTVPHETAGIAMAHGYWLVTGRMQAVMVHVNVGLANTSMGVINAASDNVPVVVLSGRTPITERGHPGSRMTPIQYGQEMYDQASLVKDVCRFHYEMRYPEQGEAMVARAAAIARAEPAGPVYLSLPREPLTAPVPEALAEPVVQAPASAAMPDPEAIALWGRGWRSSPSGTGWRWPSRSRCATSWRPSIRCFSATRRGRPWRRRTSWSCSTAAFRGSRRAIGPGRAREWHMSGPTRSSRACRGGATGPTWRSPAPRGRRGRRGRRRYRSRARGRRRGGSGSRKRRDLPADGRRRRRGRVQRAR
jgi:hypothetical protein